MMKAYTYSAKHITTGKIYYGVRKSNIFDAGITYFTSSKLVKKLIAEDGIKSFEFKLRRWFETYEEARTHEHKVLRRLKAVNNKKMLNQAISAPRVPEKNSDSEISRRLKISETMKHKWKNDEQYRNTSKFNKLSREEYRRRGINGAKNKPRSNKPPKKKPYDPNKVWKEVKISKNGVTKTIKQNQISAYRKCGWI